MRQWFGLQNKRGENYGEPKLDTGKHFDIAFKVCNSSIFALFLQAMYGAVDLVIVGKFAEVADQSGVASGSMLMSIPTTVVAGLSMGMFWLRHSVSSFHFLSFEKENCHLPFESPAFVFTVPI